MPTGIGAKSKAAVGRESTWGTGVAVIELVPFTAESIIGNRDVVTEAYHHGQPVQKNYQPTYKRVEGSLTCEGLYDTMAGDPIGIGSLLKSALGTVVWSATPTKNEFQPAADLSAVPFTIAFEKQVSIWEAQGCYIRDFEITGSVADAKIVFTFNIMARELLRTGDSGIVNTSTTFTNLVPTVTPVIMSFDQAIARIGAHGAALDADDQINVSQFRLTFDNALSELDFATPLNGASSLDPLEPIRSGKRNVNLEITVPRYSADTIFTAYNANTAQQFDLKFTSGTNEFNIFLPNVRIENPGAPIASAEFIQQTYTLKALSNENGAINGDMTFESANDINFEIGIETQNERTAVPA